MKKINLFTLALAVAAGSLASCTTKEVAGPEEELFHVVHFETSQADTKTSMTIDGNEVNFTWDETDYDVKLQRFQIWENDNKATKVTPSYNSEAKKLSLVASFAGPVSENPEYVGFLNGKVPALQVPRAGQYDADADVLAAKSFKDEEGVQYFAFQRVVAITKLTLKDLDPDETLQSVTIELDNTEQFLTAELTKGFEWNDESTGKKITLNCNLSTDSDPVLYFTSVPVTSGTFTVKAVTNKNTYSKESFGPVTLTRGNVKPIALKMDKDKRPPVNTFDINIAEINKTKTLISTSYVDNKEVTVSDYKFVADRMTTNNTNSPESGYAASKIMQFQKNSTYTGTFKNSEEMGLNSMTILSKDANTYTVYVGTSSGSLSEIPSAKVTANNDVSCKVGSSTTKSYKSKTFDLKGYSYFRIQATSTTYIFNISLTVGESTPTGIKLDTPANLAVNTDKQIVWDRVENAGSYNLYIGGGDAINCTDHYYDASSLEDGYYNVEVEAVPSNSEMFVTSEKATLANAKFGTPTLATPAPTVAKTDKTITLTWNVDAHADNGYAYTLYQDEEVVESPSADYNASEGVATLVYSNLSPKTAYSVKVNAKLVESPLRYEASEVYTSDVITTLSTINYAELQNGEFTEKPAFAASGDVVRFTATPASGYEFEGVSVTGVESASIERDGNNYSFTMPDLAEVTVAVAFKQSGFTLGTSLLNPENDHGTVVIDSPKERYTVTDVISLTVTPDAHYEYVSVSAMETGEGTNSIDAVLNEETGKYEITGLHFDAELYAAFNMINYAISVADGITNGSVTLGAETATFAQEDVPFTVKPAAGYQINTVTVSGTSGNVEATAGDTDTQGTHYTFTMPGEDVTINATFDAIDYNLVDNSGDNGSLSFKVNGESATTATIGQTVEITVSPTDYYKTVDGSVKVNGIAATKVNETTYTWVMTAEVANVTATFTPIMYALDEQSVTHGHVKFYNTNDLSTPISEASYGTYVKAVPEPLATYKYTEGTLLVYGKNNRSDVVSIDASGVFSMPGKNVSATASFEDIVYTFTKDPSSDLSFSIYDSNDVEISTSGSIASRTGAVKTIKLVATGVNNGKQAKWTVTGSTGEIPTSVVAGTNNEATFTMPVSNVTIKCVEGNAETKVTFSKLDYTSWGQSSSFSGSTYNELSQSKDNVKFDYVRGNGSTYANTTSTRFYKDNKLTFTVPSGCTITSITWTGSNFKNDVTTNVATCTSTTSALSWTGNAQTVTFTRPSSAESYITLSSVEVIYTGSPVGGDEPSQLQAPTDLAWTESTKTLSWTDSNTGKGTYNTNYKYQYSVNGGSSWLDATSSTTAVLTIASTTTVKVKAVAITTATHNSSFEDEISCTITQNTPQTATFTMTSKGQSSPVTINGVTFSWTSSNIVTGTNNGSGFKANSNMTITIPAGKKLTGISKRNGNSWGSNASIVVKTNNSNGSTIATIVQSDNDYSITSNNTGTTYYLSNTTSKNAWINSLSITYE